jgi:hypothetical protein
MALPSVKIRRSATPGKAPTTEQVALGELAINTHDGKIFLKTDVGGTETIVSFGGTTENKLLDDISASFNGSTTQFTLSSSSTNFLNTEITSVAKLLISVGGIIQEPDQSQGAGFYISGGTNITADPVKINFVEAPKTGQAFFGIVFGTSTASENIAVTPEQAIAYSIMFGV